MTAARQPCYNVVSDDLCFSGSEIERTRWSGTSSIYTARYGRLVIWLLSYESTTNHCLSSLRRKPPSHCSNCTLVMPVPGSQLQPCSHRSRIHIELIVANNEQARICAGCNDCKGSWMSSASLSTHSSANRSSLTSICYVQGQKSVLSLSLKTELTFKLCPSQNYRFFTITVCCDHVLAASSPSL